MADYTIRRFREDDLPDFISLYEDVFGNGGTSAWFNWKYRSNPYLDHVPIFVATLHGELVGARPFFSLELTDRSETWTGLQPCDTMVHPDHRGRSIFTSMTEKALAYYNDHPVDFVFNFPNDMSRAGYLKMGWQEVRTIPEHYRFHDIRATVSEKTDNGFVQTVAPVVEFAVTAYNRIRTSFAPEPDPTIEATATDTIPTETLLKLYDRSPPSALHAARDRQFYEWRYENPQREYGTILATRDGKALGAAIVGTTQGNGLTEARIVEVLPWIGNDRAVISTLMDKILVEYAHADLLSIFDETISNPQLWGFVSDRRFPISKVQQSTHLLTRPVTLEDGWFLNDHELTGPSSWSLSYAEWDTS